MNHYLGNSYTFIGRFEAPEAFRKEFENYFQKPHVADLDENADDDTRGCYGFISSEGGSLIQPLWKHQKNFVMTENGKTLTRLANY